MKFILLLLPLLLSASAAFAQQAFDLSCGNVARIRIARLSDTHWNVDSYQGHFHIVQFDLKPTAAKEFAELLSAAPWVTILYRGEEAKMQKLALTAKGKPLRDDAPNMTGLSEQAIIITIVHERDAFAAARSVCPALLPRKVVVDWAEDWERGGRE